MDIGLGAKRSRRYRATAVDVERASSRVLAVVGPLAEIDDEHICAVLAGATDCSPPTRVGLVPRSDTPLWNYESRDWRKAVTHRADLDTTNLGELVTQVHSRPGTRKPLEVLICGNYLVVDYSHALGDGLLGAVLLALLGGADGVHPAMLAKDLSKWAIWTAALRHFVLNPVNALRVLSLRRTNNEVVQPTGANRIADWESARCGFTALIEPATLAELRSWASRRYPGMSCASLTVALLAAALRDEGIEVDERVTVLVDCRRYLAARHRESQGNLAAGIPIRVPAGSSPLDVRRQMRKAIEARRPFARLVIAEVKARLMGGSMAADRRPGADDVDVPDRVRLTVSDLGRLRILEGLRWKTNAQLPSASAYVETDGPDAIDIEVTELLGAQSVTASFCSKMIPPSVIATAFKRMCDDPFGVLESL